MDEREFTEAGALDRPSDRPREEEPCATCGGSGRAWLGADGPGPDTGPCPACTKGDE